MQDQVEIKLAEDLEVCDEDECSQIETLIALTNELIVAIDEAGEEL